MISGLNYIPEFIDQELHDQLLQAIDAGTWLTDLKRRVQHYGYKYDYKSRSINSSMKLGLLPDWANGVIAKLGFNPDQLIVNEYIPGQGISNHVDCVPCFSETIASLSLGSQCVMNFTNLHDKRVMPILLAPRSLVTITDEARYGWFHGIPARRVDTFEGNKYERSRRVSMTFRKVILS